MAKKKYNTRDYKSVKTSGDYYSAMPLPSNDELADFYASVYYQESSSSTYQHSYSESEVVQKKLRAELLLYAINEVKSDDKGRFIEVGCGEGFLLSRADKQGFDVEGIDFSLHGIQSFHPELSRKVHTGDAFEILDRFFDAGKFIDICVLQNVLEHVTDPERLLNRIKSIIGNSGVLVITVPNDYSVMQNKIMELGLAENEYWFLPPQHLHYFNIDSLTKFVKGCGFEILDAYGDFPIEMFLFHEGSNYALDSSKGKGAHRARIILDLLLAERGMKPYHSFCQAMTACGIGRNVTILLKSDGDIET